MTPADDRPRPGPAPAPAQVSLSDRESDPPVLVIGPRLARTSDAIEHAFRAASLDAQFGWYEEKELERSWTTTQVSRILILVANRVGRARGFSETLRVSAHTIRFDRRKAEGTIGALVRSLSLASPASRTTAPITVLIKPGVLTLDALRALLAGIEPNRVVGYLWDPLWRTPTVKPAVALCDSAFTTELGDVGRPPRQIRATGGGPELVLLPLPPVPVRESEGKGFVADNSVAGQEGDSLFFCGTFTPVRLVRSLVVAKAARRVGLRPDITLVARSRVVSKIVRLLGLQSAPLAPNDYETRGRAAAVLVDLGQPGQDSPSDRLNDAFVFGKPLLSENRVVRDLAGVVAVERWVPGELSAALRRATSGSVEGGPQRSAEFVGSPGDWARTLVS